MLGTLRRVVAPWMDLPTSVLMVQAAAQESVGSGAGKWWLLVAGLALATLVCAALWVFVRRRTVPPAKRPYEPPPLPRREEADGEVVQQ